MAACCCCNALSLLTRWSWVHWTQWHSRLQGPSAPAVVLPGGVEHFDIMTGTEDNDAEDEETEEEKDDDQHNTESITNYEDEQASNVTIAGQDSVL